MVVRCGPWFAAAAMSRSSPSGPPTTPPTSFPHPLHRFCEHAVAPLIRGFDLDTRPADALSSSPSPSVATVSPSAPSTPSSTPRQNHHFHLMATLFRCSRSRFCIVSDACTCNILLKVPCKLGALDAALKVLDEIPEWGMIHNVTSYTAMMPCYCACGDLHCGRKFFGRIISSWWPPDATIHTVVIDGYCRHGQLEDAVNIMNEMDAAGVRRNDVAYEVIEP